jgi:ubiquitin C-terminal hydrolase
MHSLYSLYVLYTDERVVVTKDIPKEECKYDLISNICHEGEADKGAYRVYLIRRVTRYCVSTVS